MSASDGRFEYTALILRSRVSGVSKDVPDITAASWSILRDAIPHGMAPQDEG